MLLIYNPVSLNYPAGTLIKASFWLKTTNLALADGSGVGSCVQILDAQGYSVGYCCGSGIFKGTHSYMPIEYCIEIPPNATQAYIGIVLNTGITAGSIYFDDFSITPYVSPAGGGSFMTNGGFETGLTGWAQWPIAGMTIGTTANSPYEGSNCLQTDYDNTITGGTTNQDLANIDTWGLSAGDMLRYSAWVKTGTGVGSTNTDSLIKCFGTNGTPDGATWGVLASAGGVRSSWTQLTGDFKYLGGSYNWLRLYLNVDLGAVGPATVYWDDAKLEKLQADNPGPTTTAIPLVEVVRDVNNTPRLKIDGGCQDPGLLFRGLYGSAFG